MSLGVDLSGVRVHDGPAAKHAAAARKAHAFTFGNHVVLGRTAQVGGPGPRAAVLAHELVHVRQQAVPNGLGGAGSARGPPAAAGSTATCAPVRSGAPLGVQCWDAGDLVPGFVSDAAGAVADAGSAAVDVVVDAGEAAFDWVLDGVRSAARNLPGYSLVAQVIGSDPISGEAVSVERNGLIETLLTYGPFGPAVSAVLEAADVIADVFATISAGLEQNRLTVGRIRQDISDAFDEFTLSNGIAANLAIVRRYVDAFLSDVRAFVGQIADRVIEIVRSVVVTLAEPLLESDQIKPIWDLTKEVLHYDPLKGVEVDVPTVEILAGFLRLIGKEDVLAQMQERGTLQETADWLDTAVATFAGLVGQLGQLFTAAWDAIQPANLPNLLTNLASLAQQAFALVQGVGAFAATVILKVLELVKKSLLGWLSEHAHSIPGFHLITVIIGRDPFTGEAVPLTAENLIKGFITLLPGGEETYAQLAESGVIADAAARIESAMSELGITVELIVNTFLGVWNEVTLENLLAPIETFTRIVNLFGDPIARIFAFIRVVVGVVIELILRLMNFPTELIGSIISNALAAIEDIKRDPVGFLVNMLQALKAGFIGFFDHIATYLVDGLAAWLFRGLGQIGITIPTQWSLQAAFDLVLQVLGLSMEFLWRKLGEHIGEERVAQIREAIGMLSGAWQFIKDVQERGIVAIWDYIVSQLSGLWETVLSMAGEWVMTQVITVVTARLISMLDPTGVMAVINGAIAFFDAVQSAIEYIRDILEIVNMYVTTLAAVAAGNIEPGARMIEQGLAAAVPIAIGFLANQVGLGNIPEKIVEIITSLREMVEQAVDWLITQALRLGQAALNALGMGGEEEAGADSDSGATVLEPTMSGATHRIEIPVTGDITMESRRGVLRTKVQDRKSQEGTEAEHPLLDDILTNINTVTSNKDAQHDPNRAVLWAQVTGALTQAVQAYGQAFNLADIGVDLVNPMRSTDGIGDISSHGEQRDERYSGPWVTHIHSEHIIPFASARTLREVVGLTETARSRLRRFDNGMTTILIYRGAGEDKNTKDNRVSRAFRTLITSEVQLQRKVDLADVYRSQGAVAQGEQLADQAIQTMELGLLEIRHDAVRDTNRHIVNEHGETEPGATLTNGERRAEQTPKPRPEDVQEAARQQYDTIFELTADALHVLFE